MPDTCSPEQRQLIALALKRHERSIAWLARQLGMNESQLHHILRGRRRLPLGLLPRIAEILDVPLGELLVEPAAA